MDNLKADELNEVRSELTLDELDEVVGGAQIDPELSDWMKRNEKTILSRLEAAKDKVTAGPLVGAILTMLFGNWAINSIGQFKALLKQSGVDCDDLN